MDEKGEKCNKFFLNLQQRNNAKKNIQKFNKNDSKILTTPVDILNEVEKYFTETFSFMSSPVPLNEVNCKLFFPHAHVKISDEQKESCEGLITENEHYQSIMPPQLGKTPGLDGIPIDVYQTFF